MIERRKGFFCAVSTCSTLYDYKPYVCIFPDTYEYVYRGCWVYDWSAGLNMTHLHVSASESGIATVAECIYLATKTTHMYIVLWVSVHVYIRYEATTAMFMK